MILLSVLIVNYNSGKFLEKAICSVIEQKCELCELLIVDGGSADNSVSIIKKYAKYISWWVSEKDKGQSDAFNKGFAHAKGRFLMWLNADDLFLPNSLDTICNYLRKNPNIHWLTFNTLIINKNDEVIRAIHGNKWNSFCAEYYGPQVDSATSIFSRDLFSKSLGFDLRFKYAMDIDLWLQFINLGARYERLNFFVYAFRIHEESKTASGGYKCKPNQERIIQSRQIQLKNHFHPNKLGWLVAMCIKLFSTKFYSIKKTRLWKGKKIMEIKQPLLYIL